MKKLGIKKYRVSFMAVAVLAILLGGCLHGRHRHKEYTFEEKFAYKTKKILKHLEKVVSDKTKLERIRKDIFSHKDEFREIHSALKKNRKSFQELLSKAENKQEIKRSLKRLEKKKLANYNLMLEVMFEIKNELSAKEWEKLKTEINKKCSHWLKKW